MVADSFIRRASRYVPAIAALVALLCSHIPAAQAQYVPGYHIQGGDQLSISVAQDPTQTQTTTVLTDGSVVLPLTGRVVIGGMTTDQAAHALALSMRKYVRNPEVTVSVVKEGDLNIIVLGDVKTPGKYVLPSQAHLLDAIAAAGGLGDLESVDYPDARIADASGQITTIPLKGLLHDGDMEYDAPLAQNSVVYIPGRNAFNVQVLGAVDKPGDVQLHEGDRLSMAIAVAGDSRNAKSDLTRVTVTRHLAGGTTRSFPVDLAQALQRGDERYDIALHPGDVVYVPEARTNDGSTTYSILYLLGSLLHF